MKNIKKGFTLIELLVVIAIIALLSSTVFASLNSARSKARDAKRVSDLKQISLALELYYDDHGSYPDSAGAWRSECPEWGGYTSTNVIPGLVPTYLPSFPADPSMNKTTNTSCYLYISINAGKEYALLDHNGPEINYNSQPALGDPTRDGGSNPCTVEGSAFWAWKISSPGGKCL